MIDKVAAQMVAEKAIRVARAEEILREMEVGWLVIGKLVDWCLVRNEINPSLSLWKSDKPSRLEIKVLVRVKFKSKADLLNIKLDLFYSKQEILNRKRDLFYRKPDLFNCKPDLFYRKPDLFDSTPAMFYYTPDFLYFS
jgi:hypothetical protein